MWVGLLELAGLKKITEPMHIMNVSQILRSFVDGVLIHTIVFEYIASNVIFMIVTARHTLRDRL